MQTDYLYEIAASDAKTITIYNKLFIYTTDNKTFVVRNMEDEVIFVSKNYDEIYEFLNGYVLARQEDNLLILNQNDEIIKYIPMRGYQYDSYRSYYETKNKEGLYIYLAKDNQGIEVYFNPETSEYIETNY